jgi:hypothetical protein
MYTLVELRRNSFFIRTFHDYKEINNEYNIAINNEHNLTVALYPPLGTGYRIHQRVH